MLTIKNNLPELLALFNAERSSPRWLRDTVGIKKMTTEKYIEWCKKFWRIYGMAGNKAALFCERSGEIHFSAIPKTDLSNLKEELAVVKMELLLERLYIFGWVHSKNRGLKKLCEAMGMRYYGLRKFAHESHGKVIEWHCFHLFRDDELIAPNVSSVLSLTQ